MFLLELLNTAGQVNIVDAQHDRFRATVDLGPQDQLTVYIEENGDDIWEVAFARGKPGRQGNFNMTGQGNASQVLASVIEVMKEFVRKYHPRTITFTSNKSEESRTSIYGKLIARYAAMFGYKAASEPVTADAAQPKASQQSDVPVRHDRFFLVPA